MPVAKTTKAKKEPIKKKADVEEEEKEPRELIQAVIRINYPEATSVIEVLSDMSFDTLKKKYGTARSKDEVMEVSVGVDWVNEQLAYRTSDLAYFTSMLIPARYIQSIRGYKDEGQS